MKLQGAGGHPAGDCRLPANLDQGRGGAGSGNRTRLASLEGWSFTTKLYPRTRGEHARESWVGKVIFEPRIGTEETPIRAAIENLHAGDTLTCSGKKGCGGSEKGLAAQLEGSKTQERSGMLLSRASELPQPAAETHFPGVFGQSDRLAADTITTEGSVPQAQMLMSVVVGQLTSDRNCGVVVTVIAANSDGEVRAWIDFLENTFLKQNLNFPKFPVAFLP